MRAEGRPGTARGRGAGESGLWPGDRNFLTILQAEPIGRNLGSPQNVHSGSQTCEARLLGER